MNGCCSSMSADSLFSESFYSIPFMKLLSSGEILSSASKFGDGYVFMFSDCIIGLSVSGYGDCPTTIS